MKFALVLTAILAVGSLLLFQAGCSTDQPGATQTLGTYSTNLAAAPDKVTTAAAKACEDLKLTSINSAGTKVDGKVTAMTAQGQQVSIDISQAGDQVSKVDIRIGTTGDEAMSKQLVDRTKNHLGWF